MPSYRPSQPTKPFEALSESDVQAFADGLLPAAHADHVRDYLSAHPDEAHRVAFYAQLNQEMRSSFVQPAGDFLIPRLHKYRKASFIGLVLFALVLISVAIFAADVSDAQFASAARESLDEVGRVGTVQSSMDASVLQTAPDLSAVGFKPVAVRKISLGLMSRGSEYIYRNQQGEAVVLLALNNRFHREQSQWLAQREGEQRLLMWTVRTTRYVLAGRAKTRGLMRAADYMTMRH